MASQEGEWKPNGRPTSTMARSFSATLDDAFLMNDTLDSLAQVITQKRQTITVQKTELEQLEERLAQMEVELSEKRKRLPSGTSIGAASVNGARDRRQAPDPDSSDSSDEDSPEETSAKTSPAARPSPPVSKKQHRKSVSSPSNKNGKQRTRKPSRAGSGDVRTLPSRGKP